MVDIISGGRLDLGLGAGYRVPEFELFGTDVTARYRILDQQVGELRRLWGDGGLTPAPVQERLPIWLGYQGPKGARRAGRMGEGLLTAGRQFLAALPGRPGRGRPRPGRRPDGRRRAGVRDRRPGTGLAARRPAHRVRPGQLPPVHGRGNRPPGAPPGGPGAAAHPGTGRRARCRTSCSARPSRSRRRSGTYVGEAPVQTVWLGASVAGLPEDLAARHVQTICTRLRPLLAATQLRAAASAHQEG